MSVRTSAGTTLAVSATTPASFNEVGYEAVVFTTVGEITDMGTFGRAYALVTHNPIATRGTQKFKGSFNEGSMQMTLGLDTDDAGQIILKAARNSDNDYSFKVVTQNGDIYWFQAKVMDFQIGVGNVDQITTASVVLELTTSSGGIGIVENLDT